MLSLPISFFLTLLLSMVLLRLWREGQTKGNHFFVALLCVCTVQSFIVGLRWGYGIHGVAALQVVLAMAVPALLWLSFRSLAKNISLSRTWPHALPPLVAAFLLWLSSGGWLDALLLFSYLGYGIALLVWQQREPEGLVMARLDNAFSSNHALRLSAWGLIASAILDVVIGVALSLDHGDWAVSIVSASQLLTLGWLGWLASLSSTARVHDATQDTPHDNEEGTPLQSDIHNTNNAPNQEELAQINQQIEALMQQGLYRDTDLSCAKLARKVGVPARKISTTVNQCHQINVSQYVNTFRIREACRLLSSCDDSVISIAQQSGFLTKSNFNREFLRQIGSTPTEWRKQNI